MSENSEIAARVLDAVCGKEKSYQSMKMLDLEKQILVLTKQPNMEIVHMTWMRKKMLPKWAGQQKVVKK